MNTTLARSVPGDSDKMTSCCLNKPINVRRFAELLHLLDRAEKAERGISVEPYDFDSVEPSRYLLDFTLASFLDNSTKSDDTTSTETDEPKAENEVLKVVKKTLRADTETVNFCHNLLTKLIERAKLPDNPESVSGDSGDCRDDLTTNDGDTASYVTDVFPTLEDIEDIKNETETNDKILLSPGEIVSPYTDDDNDDITANETKDNKNVPVQESLKDPNAEQDKTNDDFKLDFDPTRSYFQPSQPSTSATVTNDSCKYPDRQIETGYSRHNLSLEVIDSTHDDTIEVLDVAEDDDDPKELLVDYTPTTAEPRQGFEDIESLKLEMRDAKVFVSKDEEENRDNTDEGWQDLKSLKNEFEYMDYAYRRLGNVAVSDPYENLTYHGFRRKRLAEKQKAGYHFDKHVSQRVRHHIEYVIEEGNLRPVATPSSEIGVTRSLGHSSRKRPREDDESDHLSMPPPAKRRRKSSSFDSAEDIMRQLITRLKRDLMRPSHGASRRSRQRGYRTIVEEENANWKCYLRHYVTGWREAKDFVSYYTSKGLCSEMLESIQDFEGLFRQFYEIYGPNEEPKCTDCSSMDNRNVFHPF